MKLIAGVLIKKDDKYLLVQEKQEKVYGLWNLPAGHVDEGETLQAAAKREGEEETGLSLTVGDEILVTKDDYGEIHIFEGKVNGGEITWYKEELLDVKWFTLEEIKKLPLRENSFSPLFK